MTRHGYRGEWSGCVRWLRGAQDARCRENTAASAIWSTRPDTDQVDEPGCARSRLSTARVRTTLPDMSSLTPASVPDSVPTGASFYIGARRLVARQTRQGQRIWVGRDRRFVEVVLLRTDDGGYAVAPWLEDAAPRAMRELIRCGLLVPRNPMTMLEEPTPNDDANDAALRVAVIEGLLETAQLSMDDAWHSLHAWRALRDAPAR